MTTGPRFGIVRRWWRLVLFGAALGAVAGLVALRSTPPIYRATSTLFVVPPNEASLNQSFARTYAQMAVHPVVLEQVREMLALPVSSARLEGAVTAHPVPDTQLVEIVVQFGDALRARDIANATAQAFIDQQGAQLPAGPAGPSLRIGQPVILPDQPIGLRPLPVLVLGGFVGVLVAFAAAVLLDMQRAVPAPLEVMPARQSVDAPIEQDPLPTPSMGEQVRAFDVARALIVVVVAGAVLLVPLAAMGGLRPWVREIRRAGSTAVDCHARPSGRRGRGADGRRCPGSDY